MRFQRMKMKHEITKPGLRGSTSASEHQLKRKDKSEKRKTKKKSVSITNVKDKGQDEHKEQNSKSGVIQHITEHEQWETALSEK